MRQQPARVRMEPFDERAHPPEQLDALFGGGWPSWIAADPIAAEYLPAVRAKFADFEVALLVDEVLVAAAWGVPVRWDGGVADLPTGYSDALRRAVTHRSTDTPANTLVLCAAQVRPDAAGRGLAGQVLRGLVEVGVRRGLDWAVAPLRPTGKHRYPLTDIQDYARWRRSDGQAFDAWVRTHERMGARILAAMPASQVFEASVRQWQEWSGLAMPASGQYVLPGAPSVLEIDIDTDRGRLVEPGIWVQHR